MEYGMHRQKSRHMDNSNPNYKRIPIFFASFEHRLRLFEFEEKKKGGQGYG
jgi:hypothetical protein